MEYYFEGDFADDEYVLIDSPYPEEVSLTSWDGVIATSDDWIETWEYIRGIK
jgi:hypothetical protein